jgi:transposase-like protein
MAGRKPLGPALVEHLDGSTNAKERLELILQTLAAQVTVVQACRQLEISEAMFYKLRNRVLQICVDDLEPKPRGRPARHVTAHEKRSTELAAEIVTLERELAAQTVRLELAQTLPQVVRPTPSGPEKKRNRPRNRRKKHRR